jgi:hypothetical protein
MTIDTKNLRVLAEAGKATGFDLVDMNEHDFAACQKAKRELRTAMTPTAVVELLDALERKDNLLREQLTICKYLSRSICMTDETGADTNPDNIVDSSIEAITKEIGA